MSTTVVLVMSFLLAATVIQGRIKHESQRCPCAVRHPPHDPAVAMVELVADLGRRPGAAVGPPGHGPADRRKHLVGNNREVDFEAA